MLTIRVLRESLEFDVSNRGSESIRVWDRNNPWGWSTTIVNVAPLLQPKQSFKLCPTLRGWTKTAPIFVEIPKGGHHLITLRHRDPEWDAMELIKHLRSERLSVSGSLQVALSPEASIYDVFIGEVSSSPGESEPPHLWLFGP